ncbi:MAG: hypothetical protein ACW97W_09365 [Candidatus Hodarchaeales archaeon]
MVSIAEVLIVVFFLLTLLLIIFERIPKTLAAMLLQSLLEVRKMEE